MEYILIRGSDQTKYGTLKKVLDPQFSPDNDKYPKIIVVEVDAFNYHKFDMKQYDIKMRNRYLSLPEKI